MSDPSGRYPSGILTRTAPDWFDDHLGTGGYGMIFSPPAGNNYIKVSLYNNATDGSLFKVYGISAASDGGGGSVAWSDYGQPTDTFVGQCAAIRPDVGAPYGLIYQSTTTQAAPLPNPYTFPASAPFLGGSGFDSMTYLSPFPLFIVPAGYALHVLNLYAGGILGASFWYQVSHV